MKTKTMVLGFASCAFALLLVACDTGDTKGQPTDISSEVPSLYAPSEGASRVSRRPSFLWEAITRADSYELYLSSEASGGSAPFATIADKYTYTPEVPLDANRTYYWRIVAKNALSSSQPSAVRSFTTEKPAGFPAPVYLGPVNGSTRYPVDGFAWDAVEGATGYRFLCSTTSTAEGYLDWSRGTSTSLGGFDYFFTPGYTWYWKVVAENETTSSSDTSPVWSFTPSGTGVAAPANIAVDSSYRMTWDLVEGATMYVVLRNYGGTNFVYNSLATPVPPSTRSFDVSYLSPGTIGYTVVALDAAGNSSYDASVAAAKTFVKN